MTTPAATPRQPSRRARQAQEAMRRIAVVAALGIGLGLLMQGLIILLRLVGAGAAPGLLTLAELAQTVTWSVLVCTGVALGTALGKARGALAGLVGAVFAPLALAAAKSVQKVVLSVLDAVEQPGLISLTTIGVVRALEYGILAWVLAWLAQRQERRLWPYALAGGCVAVLFGGALLFLTFMLQGLDGSGRNWLALGTMAVTELGSPLGCAVVIYLAQLVATNARLWARGSGEGV